MRSCEHVQLLGSACSRMSTFFDASLTCSWSICPWVGGAPTFTFMSSTSSFADLRGDCRSSSRRQLHPLSHQKVPHCLSCRTQKQSVYRHCQKQAVQHY